MYFYLPSYPSPSEYILLHLNYPCILWPHRNDQGVALARPKLAEFSFIAVSLRARGAAIELIVVF